MAEQDLGYKLLFAHRKMVADLLTGFIREPWVAEVETGHSGARQRQLRQR